MKKKTLIKSGAWALAVVAVAAAVLVWYKGRPVQGLQRVDPTYPKAIAEGASSEQFYESDEHWEWWDAYRDKTKVSAGFRSEMDPYYQQLMEKVLISEDENTVCSPLNTYIAFSLLAEMTEGSSRQQILDMLQVPDIDTLRTRISALWDSNYVNTPILKSTLANSIWLRKGTGYNEDTLKTLAEKYYASSFRGECGSEEMDKALQEWTDKNTGGLLSEYTKGMTLDPDTVMALVSTLYYKAAWTDIFFAGNTKPETFHGTKGDLTVDMMHRSDMMSVYRTDAFTAVSLRLTESGSMVFYLPKEGVDVNTLLADPDVLAAANFNIDDAHWSNPMVNLSLPKFNVSSKTDLIPLLPELGVTDVLDPSVSDFTPLSDKLKGLALSTADHAAVVEIDEDGVTGAAYTELAGEESAMEPPETIDLVFDRPFMFVVTGMDGSILFSGVVRNIE